MFGWFRPTCPCDSEAKQWVEKRLRWLAQQFGLHVLLERDIILPTADYFPDAWDGTEKGVRRLFRRVCKYMGVEPDAVRLVFNDDQTPKALFDLDPSLGFAAGTWQGGEQPWEKSVIRIERGGFDRPADLVGTMAHELAHQRLLGESRFDPEAFDNELLTDLAAVFFGFGVFLANNPRKSTGELSYWPGTRLRRPEYLSEPMLGYALAHIAWFRDEPKPAFANHLRWAQRSVFKQGLRFLIETGDSSFKPVRLRTGREDAD